MHYLFCHSFISCWCCPNGCVHDKNEEELFVFLFQKEKKQRKTSRFKRRGLSCDAKVIIFSASGKLQRSPDCVRMSWLFMWVGAGAAYVNESGQQLELLHPRERREKNAQWSRSHVWQWSRDQGEAQRGSKEQKFTRTPKWLIGSIRLQFWTSPTNHNPKVCPSLLYLLLWEMERCSDLSRFILLQWLFLSVSALINPHVSYLCLTRRPPILVYLKPSSSSLLFQTDLGASVQCGAPVLFGFALVFGLYLYEFRPHGLDSFACLDL